MNAFLTGATLVPSLARFNAAMAKFSVGRTSSRLFGVGWDSVAIVEMQGSCEKGVWCAGCASFNWTYLVKIVKLRPFTKVVFPSILGKVHVHAFPLVDIYFTQGCDGATLALYLPQVGLLSKGLAREQGGPTRRLAWINPKEVTGRCDFERCLEKANSLLHIPC